jgi:hypothetical protein
VLTVIIDDVRTVTNRPGAAALAALTAAGHVLVIDAASHAAIQITPELDLVIAWDQEPLPGLGEHPTPKWIVAIQQALTNLRSIQ